MLRPAVEGDLLLAVIGERPGATAVVAAGARTAFVSTRGDQGSESEGAARGEQTAAGEGSALAWRMKVLSLDAYGDVVRDGNPRT
ncbi:hypothetical protein SVIO_065570 [Streptomyces violaceusniger]|uniref:Uncharacterized protein n=1 Tax=Streptomyces violaceusniger TaxID=68280 RepID=A0A4D4L695_STRVO|nr:hypothetical protein SVIO_065570 [Streptomyces violaceusniger]